MNIQSCMMITIVLTLCLFWDSLFVCVSMHFYISFSGACDAPYCDTYWLGQSGFDLANPISAVTFSRLEPEGKLVMGFRKASVAPPSDQVGHFLIEVLLKYISVCYSYWCYEKGKA